MFSGLKATARATVAASKPTLVRFKRTTKLAPGASRIINLLSVISARKKQPRRLKLSVEDKLRHQVIESAWRLHNRDTKAAQAAQLESQYNHIKEACSTLKELDPELFAKATERQNGKRFSLEVRVPTDTPPSQVWDYNWTPDQAKSNKN